MVIHNNIKYRNIYVYIVCKKSFKKGILHGIWLDPRIGVDNLKIEIAYMLKSSLFSDQTTWCIARFEAPLPFLFLDDSTTLEELYEMAQFIEQFNEADFGAKLLAYHNGDVGEARDSIHSHYAGDFKNIDDFIKTYLKKHGYITGFTDSIIDAIDTKKLWQSWRKDKFFVIPTPPHGVQIFRKTHHVEL